MSVLITRLLSGEEILGEVTADATTNTVVIKNPTQIAAMQNPNTSKVDIHMAPFAPLSSEKSITISSRNVVFQYVPVTEIVNKYNTMFGSGIILPKNSGIATLD